MKRRGGGSGRGAGAMIARRNADVYRLVKRLQRVEGSVPGRLRKRLIGGWIAVGRRWSTVEISTGATDPHEALLP